MRHARKRVVSAVCALAVLAAAMPVPALADAPQTGTAAQTEQADEQLPDETISTGETARSDGDGQTPDESDSSTPVTLEEPVVPADDSGDSAPTDAEQTEDPADSEQEDGSDVVDVIKPEYIIDTDTENIQKVLDKAETDGENALIRAGDYTDKDWFHVDKITLYVDGVVELDSGIGLEDATLQGVTGRDEDKVIITNAPGATYVKEGALKNVTLDLSGGGTDQYQLHWESGNFVVDNSYLSSSNGTCDNGMYVGAGTVGYEFNAYNSELHFDKNQRNNIGTGIGANDENPNAVFKFENCYVTMNDNGLNGFQGNWLRGKPCLTFVNSDVEATGNGGPEDGGDGDGISYGYVTLENTDGGEYYFDVSGNNVNGFDGSTELNAALNAQGYTIIANDNGEIGINVSKLNEDKKACTLTDCTVEANGNGSYGIQLKQPTEITNSKITANNNGDAGFRFYSSSGDLTLDANSSITAQNNEKSGLYFYGKSAMLDGVLTAQGNQDSGLYINKGSVNVNNGNSVITGNHSAKLGGGVYNAGAVTLAEGVRLYNNHAEQGGDDLYSTENGTTTFHAVGEGWVLDDCGNSDITCPVKGAIDGWYDDAENNRWDAHDGNDIYHVEKYSTFTDGVATVSGLLSLKAAHGASATLQPADITIYMGGHDGYDGVQDDGQAQTSPSLPEPGFFFTLPADLNYVISKAMGVDDVNTALDLSGMVTMTAGAADGKPRTWTLERYGAEDGTSTAVTDETGLERFIYRIVPVEVGQNPVRVTFTDPETGKTVVSDEFDPAATGELSNEYTMDLYTNGVDVNSVTMTFRLPEDKGGQVYSCGYDDKNSPSGTLTVRYASEEHTIADAGTDLEGAMEQNPDDFYVEHGENQQFYINEQDKTDGEHLAGVSTDVENVSLLVDNVSEEEHVETMYARVAQENAFENAEMTAKYLDLVDIDNGNAWLTPADGTTVKVYWPYPEGTDQNTKFELYHFEGLDREDANSEVDNCINTAKMENMKITKEENGLTFETGSFSPFVLVWEGTGEENPSGGHDGGNTTDQNTPAQTTTVSVTDEAPAPAAAPTATAVPQTSDDMPLEALTVVATAAAAAFVVLAVRKRRHGKD